MASPCGLAKSADRDRVRTRGIIVLGMHRSGTSCLTGLLHTSGVWLGDTSIARRMFGIIRRRSSANAKGSLEDRPIRQLNNRILQASGGDWHEPPAMIDPLQAPTAELESVLEPYTRHELWAIKDPRMVLTLDLWLPYLARYDLVGTFRAPTAVARSLLKRNQFPLQRGVAIWTAYNRRLVAYHRQSPFPLLSFDVEPDLYLQQFELLCARLHIPYRARAARAWYEREMVTQSPDDSCDVGAEAAELYDYLNAHSLHRCVSGGPA